MKVTLEKSDLLKTLEKVLGRSLEDENVTVKAKPFNVLIEGLTIEDLIKVNATIAAETPAAPVAPTTEPTEVTGTPAEAGPVTAEDMARIAEENRRLSSEGGGAGPVPGGVGPVPTSADETPEDFLPPGGSFDPPPPTDLTGK
jgi:hypothetical protein